MMSIFISVIIHEATLKGKSLHRIERFGLVFYLALEAVIETIHLFHRNILLFAVSFLCFLVLLAFTNRNCFQCQRMKERKLLAIEKKKKYILWAQE